MMGRRAKNRLSFIGTVMGVIALLLAFAAMPSHAGNWQPVVAAQPGLHWPQTPEECTAWVLMGCSALASVANVLDSVIRRYWQLREDRPGRRRRRPAAPVRQEKDS